MDKITSEESRRPYRGPGKGKKEEKVWMTSTNPTHQTIVCFYERVQHESREYNWTHIQQICKNHVDRWWEKPIDKRPAIFVRVDNRDFNPQVLNRVKRSAKLAKVTMFSGVAYLSEELEREVLRILQERPSLRLYPILIHAYDEERDCIYIVRDEHEDVIYVGQTLFLSQRMTGHRHSQEAYGFMEYVRYNHERSADWSVQILPKEQCKSFAVQGQLTPDLMNDQKAQQLLTERYNNDRQWALTQAETALIAYFRPHFNQQRNVYPRPLKHPDYCVRKCTRCLHTRE